MERRELMLDAATAVFGERGYVGATTDAIADAAGVSQAYVVRTFGSKDALFGETASRALDRIVAVFRDAADASGERDLEERLGRAYLRLVADRGILLTFMQLLALGHHPEFGPLARRGILSIYRVLRDEADLSSEQVAAFLAKGTLINAILGLRLPDAAGGDADMRELLDATFGSATDEVVALTTQQPPLPPSARSGSRLGRA